MNIDEVKDHIRGCLIGGAIGDALGYPIEFETNIRPRQVTKFKNDKGVISDDTQMTLFTACALLWRDTRWTLRGIAPLPHEAIYIGYLDWLSTQQKSPDHQPISWIKDVPELNAVRDPGNTCLEALASGKAGTLGEPVNNSKGCGGIMRLAPISLSIFSDDNVGEFSAKSCALTHGHPLAILSAYTLGIIICYVAQGCAIEKSVKTALSKMNDWKPEAYRNSRRVKINWDKEKNELTNLIERAITLAKNSQEDLTAIYELGSGWVAEETLAIAIYCSLKYESSFGDAIVAAVNHDGDSDSTGAITGNIIGAALGYDKIPAYYKDNVQLKNIILELADDLTTGAPTDNNGNISDESWLKKYLYPYAF